jgi:hypothetical protein
MVSAMQKPGTVLKDLHGWLDKHIEEQAAYYGMSVEAYTYWFDELCHAQLEIESTGEPINRLGERNGRNQTDQTTGSGNLLEQTRTGSQDQG